MRAPSVAVWSSGPRAQGCALSTTQPSPRPASRPGARHGGLCRERVAPAQHDTHARSHTEDVFWALKAARLEPIGPFS